MVDGVLDEEVEVLLAGEDELWDILGQLVVDEGDCLSNLGHLVVNHVKDIHIVATYH